ncbi:heterokaryon incompatibility protein s [Colletotrichum spaethianum]|uniref:Heterokaryon incompatibility protein s n=1 Tax=Colletotrichum spaethianum TaxID=700344 RepID=A0AA37NY78_9PEZI|nr:heterokaryon incompatibility protein s [Colletotrichum spaethianum]GKT43130.1 heterokaryon incompatibility protein s [Colletotrichum spaethianum]
MAEVSGTFAGALSVAALFNNCVTCFEYIQLGRNFGRDYQGESVNVNGDARFAADTSGGDTSVELARSIIEEIILLIQGAQKTSRRYELSPEPKNLSLLQMTDMTPMGQRLHHRAGALARRRQKGASVLKKTTWALYDGKQLGKLMTQITAPVDDLEKLFPLDATRRRLAEMEIEDIDDESSRAALQESAKDTDEVLLEAVDRKINMIAGSNSVGAIRTKDRVDV